MHEWLQGLQKSAINTSAGVDQEDIRRAETQNGVPFPEELGLLWRSLDGGTFQGEVTLFQLHGAEGAPSVLEKTRMKLEGLPAAGLWRIGIKGAHRHLFAARKSALVEHAEASLPSWADSFLAEDWLYGTWESEVRELRLYKSLQSMLEILVPPKEVEEFGDRTYAQALSAVQGALSDLSEDEEGEDSGAEDDEDDVVSAVGTEDADDDAETAPDDEDDVVSDVGLGEEEDEAETSSRTPEDAETEEALRQPVVAAARRRTVKLQQKAADTEDDSAEPEASTPRAVKSSKAPAKKAAATRAPAPKAPAKKAAATRAPAKKAPAQKAPAKKAPAKKAAATRAPAKKGPAQKAPAKKAPAKKAAATRAPAKKAPAKKASAKKAPAKSANKRGAARSRR